MNLQSARSYLSEAVDKLNYLAEYLQELADDGLDDQEAGAGPGTLSQVERALSLAESALASLDKIHC